ncbi:TIGR04255 family protein [Ohtaekwangia koreensis]|uniref:TIGR04255 family protein n=1 Tax=Ohtaekwangia koreensis TaxID=688867 RepID=A0A1T5LDU3_9BACT|nr:TIGR04255 family protein [Ohtaekwangia koreensis]SKC73578.1 TIGR04255 family protein [Ohtaekwangia koreensis]
MIQTDIPKKITPDPIVDSVVEFRFSSQHPKDRLTTLLLNHFSVEFPSFRDFAPQIGFPLEFTTKVSLHNDNFNVNIGPNVISFGCMNSYKGWSPFSAIVTETMHNLSKQGLINEIERVGLRYINFFKNIMLISQNTNLDISFSGRENYTTRSTSLRTQLQKDPFIFNVIIADNVVHNNVPGSILDIDVATEHGLKIKFSDQIIRILEQAHSEEKMIFYSLLKNDFVKKFNPEY